MLHDELAEAIGPRAADTRIAPPEEPAADRSAAVPASMRSAFEPDLIALLVTFAAVATVGVIVSLATRNWWALVAAVSVHAVWTAVIVAAVLRLVAAKEHVAPGLAARLEAEGVTGPDRFFTALVDGEGNAPGSDSAAPSTLRAAYALARMHPGGALAAVLASVALGTAVFMIGTGFIAGRL